MPSTQLLGPVTMSLVFAAASRSNFPFCIYVCRHVPNPNSENEIYHVYFCFCSNESTKLDSQLFYLSGNICILELCNCNFINITSAFFSYKWVTYVCMRGVYGCFTTEMYLNVNTTINILQTLIILFLVSVWKEQTCVSRLSSAPWLVLCTVRL